MTASHFIRGQNNSQWYSACDIPDVQKTFKNFPKGSVYAVELSTDGHLTLQGDTGATFGNSLVVEPYRQGCTQDFHFE